MIPIVANTVCVRGDLSNQNLLSVCSCGYCLEIEHPVFRQYVVIFLEG